MLLREINAMFYRNSPLSWLLRITIETAAKIDAVRPMHDTLRYLSLEQKIKK